jgi:hypothetical protein
MGPVASAAIGDGPALHTRFQNISPRPAGDRSAPAGSSPRGRRGTGTAQEMTDNSLV